MSPSQADLARRLLTILHRGLVQARSLALAADHQQLADLTDALEILPELFDDPASQLDLMRSVLTSYQEKYPCGGYYDYLAVLEPEHQPVVRPANEK